MKQHSKDSKYNKRKGPASSTGKPGSRPSKPGSKPDEKRTKPDYSKRKSNSENKGEKSEYSKRSANTEHKGSKSNYSKTGSKPRQKTELETGEKTWSKSGYKSRYARNTDKPKIKKEKDPVYSETMRLNRYIANAGICSRREADTYISAGVVTINGKIVTELGTKVLENDEVKLEGQRLNPEIKVYLLLNKPKDFVTTTDNPDTDKTVMSLVKNACSQRVYPVGRMDKNTTGLLMFTNDGALAKKLTHPSHNHKKIYQASLDKPLTKQHIESIANGVVLDDGRVVANAISYINNVKTEIGIEIHSGKNRVVSRIFEHFGYKVKKLDRVYFAGLTKKNLPRGKWRFLEQKEINILKIVQ